MSELSCKLVAQPASLSIKDPTPHHPITTPPHPPTTQESLPTWCLALWASSGWKQF